MKRMANRTEPIERIHRAFRRAGRPGRPAAAGYTLTELMIAAMTGTLVSLGLAGFLVMSSKMGKSITSQQIAVAQEMKAVEGINREIRMATSPLLVTDESHSPATQGNRVAFRRTGEAEGQRTITLESGDNDPMTPADNRLVLDPDTTRTGDEIVLARNLSPLEAAGAFRCEGATSPLRVGLRIGDPASGATAASNAQTGTGLQGLEINICVAPRNDTAN